MLSTFTLCQIKNYTKIFMFITNLWCIRKINNNKPIEWYRETLLKDFPIIIDSSSIYIVMKNI